MFSCSWLAIMFTAGMAVRQEVDMNNQIGLETTGCNALSCDECVGQSNTYFSMMQPFLGEYCVWYVQQEPTGAPGEKFETGRCGEPTETMKDNFINVRNGECKTKKKAWTKMWETIDYQKKIFIELDKLEKAAQAFKLEVDTLDFTHALGYSMGDVKKIGNRVDGAHGPVANPMKPNTYAELSVRDLWKHVSRSNGYSRELDDNQDLSDRVKDLNKERQNIWKSLIKRTCDLFTEEKLKRIEKIWTNCVCFGKSTSGMQEVRVKDLKQYVGVRQKEHREGNIQGDFNLKSLKNHPISLTIASQEKSNTPGSIDVWDGLHRLSKAYDYLEKAAVTFRCK